MAAYSQHADLLEGSGTVTAPVPRSTASVITEFDAPTFENVWPEVSARLGGILRQRVDPATAEDIVQETALRVVRNRVAFSDAEDLLRWASRVGTNLAIDERRRRRFIDSAPVPECEGPHNVAAAVDQRMTLDALASAIKRLSEVERKAI